MSYYYADHIIKQLKNAPKLIVFGAGNVASLVIECLQSEFYSFTIEYCMVSDMEGNPEQVKGVPVIDFEAASELVYRDSIILIAIVETYLGAVMDRLREHGYKNLLPLTFENDLWSMLRGNVYRSERLSQNKSYLTIEDELSVSGEQAEEALSVEKCVDHRVISIYSARCHMDKKLDEDISKYAWEIPIQVGAALTDKQICDIQDNKGDHISDKNGQYCELTALYWIWKNDCSDYVGLGHYRRHFELNEEQLQQLARSDIDVVLTIPIMDIPSVEVTYRRDHIGTDWDVMLEAVQMFSPDYMDTVRRMQRGQFYYAYNMFIMRREILEDYCKWLFPILFYCEDHCEERCREKRNAYQSRYIGFLAEHLMSVYFIQHENEYKIVHARKHFIL